MHESYSANRKASQGIKIRWNSYEKNIKSIRRNDWTY